LSDGQFRVSQYYLPRKGEGKCQDNPEPSKKKIGSNNNNTSFLTCRERGSAGLRIKEISIKRGGGGNREREGTDGDEFRPMRVLISFARRGGEDCSGMIGNCEEYHEGGTPYSVSFRKGKRSLPGVSGFYGGNEGRGNYEEEKKDE